MLNPRTRLNDAYFTLEKISGFLDAIKAKRIENPGASIILTNLEVWSLVRSLEFLEGRYVTNSEGTVENPEIVDGVKTFLQNLNIPDGTQNPHAVNYGQLVAVQTAVLNYINATLMDYATQSWVTANFYPLTGNPSGFITGAGIGLSIDGNGDIKLGGSGGVTFTPDSNLFFYMQSNSPSYIQSQYIQQMSPLTAGGQATMIIEATAGQSYGAHMIRMNYENPIMQWIFVDTARLVGIETVLNKLADTLIFRVTDEISQFGLRYAANYFANGSLNDRWIPDWGAVKGYVAGEAVGAGAGLSIDGNGNIQLGDATTVFFTPISGVGAKNGAFRFLGSLEVDDVDGEKSSKFEVYNTSSYPRLRFVGTLTGGVGDTLTSELHSGQASGRSDFYAIGSHQGGRRAGFEYDIRNTGNLPIGDSLEMYLDKSAGQFIRLRFYGDGTTYSAIFSDSINSKGLQYAANYFAVGSLDDRWIPDWGAVTGYVGGQGFLTSETDPTVAAHIKAITSTQITNWNTAFGWGDHSVVGYITQTNSDLRYVRYDINNQSLDVTQRQNARTNILAVSTDTADLITGLKTIRRAGASDGTSIQNVLAFEIGPDDLYKLFLSNSQNEGFTDGEVNWFFRKRSIYGDAVTFKGVTNDHFGFFRAGVSIIGGHLPSAAINTDIRSWITGNYATELPYPISTYIHRDVMVSGRGYFGKSNLDNTLFLGSDDMLFSEGTVYGAKGLRTADAENPLGLFNGSIFYVGSMVADATGAHTHKLKFRHNGTVYNVLAQSI